MADGHCLPILPLETGTIQVSYEMTLVAATAKVSHVLIIVYDQVELRLQAYLTSVLGGGEPIPVAVRSKA